MEQATPAPAAAWVRRMRGYLSVSTSGEARPQTCHTARRGNITASHGSVRVKTGNNWLDTPGPEETRCGRRREGVIRPDDLTPGQPHNTQRSDSVLAWERAPHTRPRCLNLLQNVMPPHAQPEISLPALGQPPSPNTGPPPQLGDWTTGSPSGPTSKVPRDG